MAFYLKFDKMNVMKVIKIMKVIKNWVKRRPFAYHIASHLYNNGNLFKIYREYKKKIVELNETKRILKVSRSRTSKKVIVVYDLLSSPSVYGDFFYVVMLARYFLLLQKDIELWMIVSDYRKDILEVYNEIEIKEQIEKILEIPRLLLNKGPGAKIQVYNWSEAHPLLHEYKRLKDIFILFETNVLMRSAFYIYAFNVINNIFRFERNIEYADYLLSIDELRPQLEIRFPESRYVTWHVRYSEKWGFQRNISVDEFLSIYYYLYKAFPGYQIMVISDETGCNYFRELSYRKGLDLIFSKDYSNSFMGDAALILNSSCFFSIRGGGIASVPIFSKVPYCYIAKAIHERPLKKRKIAVWSTDQQIFINDTKWSSDKFFYKT